MYKVIAFDCWGTLFTNTQDPHPFAAFAQELGHKSSDREYLKKFETACMTDCGPVEEHVALLLAGLRVAPDADLVQKLQDLILGSIPTQTIFADTAATLDALRKNYRLALISNTFKESFDALRQKYPIDKWFTDVLLSCELGAVKPSTKPFEALVERTGVVPSEILMVGDNYYDDVLAANEAGTAAVLLDRKGRFPDITDRKITKLAQLDEYLQA